MRIFALVFFLFALGCGARSGVDDPRHDASTEPNLPTPPSLPDSGSQDAGVEVDAAICGGECDDGLFCNGLERCDPVTTNCVPGEIPDCDDGDECTIDRCDATLNDCAHERVERDEDGDGVGACAGDCDDRNPLVRPGFSETCDTLDNDCDGNTDEGVLSPCGDCRPGCNRAPVDGPTGWDASGDAAGVTVDSSGALSLSRTRTESYYAWIANHLFGTITKLDTRDGTQAAEYDSAILDGTNDARMPGEMCDEERSTGNCPSRTAVDLRGAVYIANRAFGNQSTVTKIAGFESDCVDRNGNGTIETSRDLDGDGVIERGVPGEFLGQADECILWTVNVGDNNGIARAVAIDMAGTVWIGLNESGIVLQLDPNNGNILQEILLPRAVFGYFRPYGAAADSVGNVWFVEAASGRIIPINTSTGRVGMSATASSRLDACSGSYGIAIDDEDRVWIAGFQCDTAFRYDPATLSWFEVQVPDSGLTRGIAVDADGTIYLASSHESIIFGPGGAVVSDPISRLTIFNGDDGRMLRILGTPAAPLPGLGATGVGLDSFGQVWLINQDSSTATRIDPVTGAARDFPTGESPYTYSDFTGFALRTFTSPNGYHRSVIEGCAVGPTQWERMDWDADVPSGTRIEVRVRTANNAADLSSRTWVGPWTVRPTDLALPPGPIGTERFIEVELTLVSDDEAASPLIRDVTLQYNCPV